MSYALFDLTFLFVCLVFWQHQCPGTNFSISAEQATPKVSDLKPEFKCSSVDGLGSAGWFLLIAVSPWVGLESSEGSAEMNV